MAIESLGTGRVDYSENVEYATVAQIRSHQRRVVSCFDGAVFGNYSFEWPYYSGTPILIPPTDSLPPSFWDTKKHYIQKIVGTSGSNHLIALIMYKIPSFDVALTYSPTEEDIFGSATGYGKAELIFSKGIVYDATFCVIVGYQLTLDNPYPSQPRGNYLETTDSFWVNTFMIREETVYGL